MMTETMLLQVAADNYSLEPEEKFGVWFQDRGELSKNEK